MGTWVLDPPYLNLFHNPAGRRNRPRAPSRARRDRRFPIFPQTGVHPDRHRRPPKGEGAAAGAPIPGPFPGDVAAAPCTTTVRELSGKVAERRFTQRPKGSTFPRPCGEPQERGPVTTRRGAASTGPSFQTPGNLAYVPLAWPWVDHSASGQRGETAADPRPRRGSGTPGFAFSWPTPKRLD